MGNIQQSKVRVQRWPSVHGPLLGPPVIILDLHKAAEALSFSGFMKPFIVEMIKQKLEAGEVFVNRAQVLGDDELPLVPNGHALALHTKSEYRIATQEEVLTYVDSQEYANVTGHAVSKRAQSKVYVLHYHEGAKLIEAYEKLPRQAREVLDILNEASRDSFSEASIEVLLGENVGRLKTRQEPIRIFGFYRRDFIDQGHLEEVEGGD